ncbi:MAG: glycosyltransferase family 2 protein [Steroidobacteraceae bacterium]
MALTTCNGAKYLREQLASHVAQTLLPCEIVVSDDCSTDASVSIVEAFARQSPVPVRLIRNPTRLGYSENFLATIARCRGDFIALSDQDDVWTPDKLAICLEAMRASEAALTMHSAAVVDGDLNVIGELRQFGAGRKAVLPPLAIDPLPLMAYGLTLVFRRRLLQLVDCAARPHSASFPEQLMSHDEWIFLLASIFGTIAIVPDRLVLYRQHGANVYGEASAPGSGVQRWRQISLAGYERRLAFLSEVASVLEQHGPRLEGRDRWLAKQGARRYMRLASHMQRRLAMHRARGAQRRMARFAGMVLHGAYLPRALGLKSMLKDFLAIVRNPVGNSEN